MSGITQIATVAPESAARTDMNEWNWWQIASATTVSTAIRYFLFAGVAWLLGYVWFRRKWFHRKIIQALPTSGQVRLEIRHSFTSLVVFGLVGWFTIEAAQRGWTQMYWRLADHSIGWWWSSIGLTILLHDTWFYWTHRAMHHPRLFRHFHRTHHLFANPTPWASFAFSPLEALVQAAIFPLAVMVMPLHPLAFAAFMVWQMFFNVVGHCGYEYNRRGFMRSPLKLIANTPTNHIMHHEKMRGNYGLYFSFWDRLMGTNHRDYEQRFDEVTSRPRLASSAEISPSEKAIAS